MSRVLFHRSFSSAAMITHWRKRKFLREYKLTTIYYYYIIIIPTKFVFFLRQVYITAIMDNIIFNRNASFSILEYRRHFHPSNRSRLDCRFHQQNHQIYTERLLISPNGMSPVARRNSHIIYYIIL